MILLRMLVWLVGLWLALAWVAIAALMVQGCGPRPAPLTPAQVDAVAAAERGWRLAGLPPAGACLEGLSVRRGDCGPEVNSCLLHEGAWVVVLDETSNPRAAIVHESLHALYACAMPRVTWADPYDRQHTNVRVWAHHAGSAETLAR